MPASPPYEAWRSRHAIQRELRACSRGARELPRRRGRGELPEIEMDPRCIGARQVEARMRAAGVGMDLRVYVGDATGVSGLTEPEGRLDGGDVAAVAGDQHELLHAGFGRDVRLMLSTRRLKSSDSIRRRFRRGDNLAIIGDNRPRLYWSMLAAQALGGVAVPMYQDAPAAEFVYVLNDAEIAYAVVEDQEQVDKMLEATPQVRARFGAAWRIQMTRFALVGSTAIIIAMGAFILATRPTPNVGNDRTSPSPSSRGAVTW